MSMRQTAIDANAAERAFKQGLLPDLPQTVEQKALRPGQLGLPGNGDNGRGGLRGDPCAGAIWNNGFYDEFSGLVDFRATDGSMDAWVVDDVSFSEPARITDFHWYSVEGPNFAWNGTDDVIILLPDGAGGAPGTVRFSESDLTNEREDTGVDVFGLDVVLYTLLNTAIDLNPGSYFVGMRPVAKNASVYSYIMTAAVTGSDSYFRSPNFGQDDWGPTADRYGAPKNHAFCLTGLIGGPCRDAIYKNGSVDKVNSYSSQRSPDPNWITSWTADDMLVSRPWLINDFHWYTQDRPDFDFNGTIDLIILNNDGAGGGPGTSVVELSDQAATRTDTGDTLFGDVLYQYDCESLSINLNIGTYFLGLRPVQNGSSGQSFWATAPLTGSDSYILSPFFGYNDWTPWENLVGVKSNVAFCVTGRLPDPCRNAVWSNGDYNYDQGMNSSRCIDPAGPDSLTADDVRFNADVFITDLHWYALDANFSWNGTDDVMILAPDGAGGIPGTVLVDQRNLPNFRANTGDTSFGLPIYLYTLEDLGIPLSAGDYWVAMRPVQDPCTGESYLATAALTGSEAYLIAPYYGVDQWTPWSTFIGIKTNAAFCMTGYFSPCRDTGIYDNGMPDGATGLNASRSTDPNGVEIWTVDDVDFNQRVRIRDLHWWAIEFNGFNWNGTDDVIILDDDGAGGAPGTVLVEQFDIPNTRVDTGGALFGLTVWLYAIDGVAYDLDPGIYFIGMRPVSGATDGVSFNLTTAAKGSVAYVRSVYYGIPDWTTWESQGRPYDYAFCLTGIVRTGACCLKDDCVVTTKGKCENNGGTYQGDDTDCDPNPCRAGEGACCREGECLVTTKEKCVNNGGEYLGDGTDCDPNPCVGACCFKDGSCSVTYPRKCRDAGGEYQGGTTDCDPNPCPQPKGACCLQDGTCKVGTKKQCDDAGGRYQGDDTDCDPNPCDQKTGACCINRDCVVTTKQKCDNEGGKYQGDGVPCDDRICRCVDNVLGDSNCDGFVDFDDIDCFVAALIGKANWDNCGHGQGCDYLCVNDINGDGSVDFDDIDAFVKCIINSGCP